MSKIYKASKQTNRNLMSKSTSLKLLLYVLALLAPLSNMATAEDGTETVAEVTETLPEVKVSADSQSSSPGLSSILPEIVDEQLTSGKKTTSTKLDSLPEIATNNYRQIVSQTAGLLVSEVPNESLVSMNYRGLGDPHESFNLLLLQDGIPINADPYGYPAAYYATPSDYVDEVQFTRGGAALQFGPQAGGALNFITRQPRTDTEFSFRTKQLFGSKSLYSTYNEISGTKDGVQYLANYHHRQSDGFRNMNSDYRLDFGSIKVGGQLSSRTKIMFQQDMYDSTFAEAGGLTLEEGDGLASYNQDRWQNTLNFDTLSISRYMSSIVLNHEVSRDTGLLAKAWAGYLSRESRRQSYGTAENFGGIANGTTNTIVLQEFKTAGLMLRGHHDWTLFDEGDSTLAGGVQLYGVDSPFTQSKGATPDAVSGALSRKIDRSTIAFSAYAENKFSFDKLHITPGIRLESINQSLDDRYRADSPLLNSSDSYNLVPLLGLGISYDLTDKTEIYANASQAYKPVTYQDTLPLGPTDQVSSDIDEARIKNYEVGVRGTPYDFLSFDLSTFYLNFSNQFGRVGNVIGNTGKGRYYGVDISSQVSLLRMFDAKELSDDFGSFSLYGNASLLNAEFNGGPLDGLTPQYAPDYLIRTGFVYEPLENTKFAFLGTFVDSSFADDGNTANRIIPSYKVWDLTADISLWTDRLSLTTGINNVFDEKYYSRIRSNGIDPALPRNYYVGFNAYF